MVVFAPNNTQDMIFLFVYKSVQLYFSTITRIETRVRGEEFTVNRSPISSFAVHVLRVQNKDLDTKARTKHLASHTKVVIQVHPHNGHSTSFYSSVQRILYYSE